MNGFIFSVNVEKPDDNQHFSGLPVCVMCVNMS